MSEACYFCSGPVNPHDESSYHLVSGWVHGKKRDSMTLREDMGMHAHEHCILKARGGQAADQQSLLDDENVEAAVSKVTDTPDEIVVEIFEKVAPPPTIQALGEMLGLVPSSTPPHPSPNPYATRLGDDMDSMAFGHTVTRGVET